MLPKSLTVILGGSRDTHGLSGGSSHRERGRRSSDRRPYTPLARALVCAWCGRVVRNGTAPASDTMCVDCLDVRHPARATMRGCAVFALIPALLFVAALLEAQ